MNDPVFIAMLELCMSMGNLTCHRAHTEEEALLYQQLCRTIGVVTKAQEQAIGGTLTELLRQAEDEDEDDSDGH